MHIASGCSGAFVKLTLYINTNQCLSARWLMKTSQKTSIIHNNEYGNEPALKTEQPSDT